MEAQGRRLGAIFPSYNGPTLPQAIHSSQGKGKLSKQQSNCSERPGFFELLATVAGQFLQNDEVVQEDNITTNKIKPLIINNNTLHNMNMIMQQSSKDVTRTSIVPQNVENMPFHKERNGIHQFEIDNSANLSRCNSFMLHELPIPSFVKSIMMDEFTYQQNITSSSKKDQPHKLDMEFEDTMLIEHDSVLKIINETSNSMETEDHVFTKDLYLKNSNENNIAMYLNQIDNSTSKETLNGGDKTFTLNQSHDSICENCNSFHTLEMNIEIFKAFNGSIELNKSTKSNNVLSSKLDATIDSCFSNKINIKNVQNNMATIDLKAIDQDQTLTGVETIIHNQNHLIYPKNFGFMNSLKNMPYINSKQIEEDHDVIKKDYIIQKQSKFDKKDKIKGHRSSQRLLHETMTKKMLEANTNGLRPCRMTTICNNLPESKAKFKEDGIKPVENVSAIPTKQTFFNGIAAFTRQRTSRRLPLKRKRLEDSDLSSSDLHVKLSNPMDEGYDGIYGEPPAAAAKLRSAKAASVASSPTTKGTTKPSTKKFVEPHVKFGIKSFTIPEIFIELPESASILTLKKAVMDAAMNLLGGGLRVRVLMHGKKVIDEGASLSQTGIFRSLKPESLGFMLEPSPIPTSSTATFEDPFLVLSRPTNQSSPRFQASKIPNYSHCQGVEARSQGITYSKGNSSAVIEDYSLYDEDPTFSQSHLCGVDHQTPYMNRKRNTTTISYSSTVHNDQLKNNNINVGKTTTTKSNLTERIALSPHSTRIAAVGALAAIRAQADANRRLKNDVETPLLSNNHTLHDSSAATSKAIILHPNIEMEDNMHGLALVSMQQKPRSLDIGKRRVRRPFSVAEVEALVYAVEKLGTSRWRDVKLRAFEQAKHRTYVDLKDKWKTLVHTARIAPHQRRGEPVPQELLERVTRAHTYWTAQAAKQQAELDF